MKLRILNFAIRRPRVYFVSVMLTIILCYGIGSGSYYLYLHEKLEVYSNSILSRSDSLIKQVQLIDGLRDEFSVYSPLQ